MPKLYGSRSKLLSTDGASYWVLIKRWCALVGKIKTTSRVLYAGATMQENEESFFTLTEHSTSLLLYSVHCNDCLVYIFRRGATKWLYWHVTYDVTRIAKWTAAPFNNMLMRYGTFLKYIDTFQNKYV